MDKWQTPISYLKGVGPERAKVLQQELNIENFYDLLHFFPFRYLDKSQFYKISDLHPELQDAVQIEGKIIQIKENNLGKKPFLQVVLQDQTGKIQLIWFQFYKILLKKIRVGQTWIVYGKVKFNNGIAQISHPELSEKSSLAWEPVYSSTQIASRKGLDSKGIQKLQKELFSLSLTIPEIFPEAWIKKLNFISREQAYRQLHFPKNILEHQQALQRLKFEELFFLQWIIYQQRQKILSPGLSFEKVGNYFNIFYQNYLPFELTEAQKKVLKEIRKDLASGSQMNRLLQGDVGAGKTIVAFLSLLLALDNGFQGLLLAPTEILAQQHYQNFQKLILNPVTKELNSAENLVFKTDEDEKKNEFKNNKNLDLKIDFLSGSLTKKDKNLCLNNLSEGKTQILVGTHALLEEPVIFKNLGLAIVDEQHRFGVKQRAALWKKNQIPPHILVMTATPIPRTLAMTLYGDLSISILDQRPKGRQKIQTFHVTEKKRLQVFGLMEREIAKGRQIYIVYPMIDENEKLDYHNLMEGYNSITRHFSAPKYQVSIVHGRMKGEEKNYEMQRFLRQETQIMVATTVIEVGVDVPNATVMVIENAERFGLAQLHQLRGRVGRGSELSYCLLMTKEKISRESLTRMQTLVNSDNGFEIAEVDLQLRGHGDLMGTEQSGNFSFRIANLSTDGNILEKAKKAVEFLSEIDPNLEKFFELKKEISNLQIRKPNWGKIS